MKRMILSLLAVVVSPFSATADSAFFTKDGKSVVFVGRQSGSLQKLDLESHKVTSLTLPGELKDKDVDAIAQGSEGEIIFLSAGNVWAQKTDGTTKKICPLGRVKTPWDIFLVGSEPKMVADWIFVTGDDGEERDGLLGRKPGGKDFGRIFCRRLNGVRSGHWTADGRFFFVSDGDLWEGGVDTSDADAQSTMVGTLVGARIAPVAAMNTDSANGGGQFADKIVVAGHWIYLGLRGRHMGTIVRVPLPAKPLYSPAAEEMPSVKQQHEAMAASLSKTEVLAEDLDGLSAFAAAEIGGQPHVFYRGESNGLYLWTPKGTAEMAKETE